MRTTLAAASFAAAIGLVWCQGAGAVPARPMEMQEAAAAASVVQETLYVGRTRHHGILKCYHELLIGPYVCHRFYRWGW
jgi:hypothetical protein